MFYQHDMPVNTLKTIKEKRFEKLKILSVAPVFAEAIRRIYEDVSVSKIFDVD